jgi:hypothetical protein
MARSNSTEIFSIFGQIEAVAAQLMIDRGLATRIVAEQIPQSVAMNDAGQRAKFAIIIKRRDCFEFEKLIAELRA